MQINATLIVQMINFGVIYFLLDRLLFRKAIAILQNEEYQEQKILEELLDEQKKLNNIKQTISTQWNESQKEFIKISPSTHIIDIEKRHTFDFKTPLPHFESSEKKLIEEVAQKIKKTIEQKWS